FQVFDEEDNDVTPLPLYQADPSVFGSSRISSQSTIESMNEEIEDTISKRDMPINFPVQGKRESVREQLTEEMLRELIDVDICETDSISLLDIPSTLVSVDADDAEVIARNNHYADVCRNRMGNDKYTDQSVQTLNGAAKNKHVQSDSIVTVDTATVTTWDMYDTLCDPEQDVTVQKPEPAQNDYPEAAVDTSRAAERSLSVGSTASAASSLKEMEVLGSLNAESDLQLIMLSVRFQQSLLVMERSILGNTFQPQLAAYRQLPVPDRPMGQRDKDTESCRAPTLERLWSFSCELSRGRSVSSMAWNRKNPDLLAVGYGESDSTDQRPGLVCCWSFKNPTQWPERVLLCDSAVTSLDFSAKSPGQLAVGLHDGTVNIYNVQSQDDRSHVFSSECPNKHLGPVWQLRWTQQELSLTGEEKTEALFSVCADGRISKWFVFNNGLDCTVMKLKRIHNTRKNNKGQRTESVLSALTPGLCVDFHPTDSSLYLAGTGEGLIHKCSCSNSQQFLETFREHVAWCPHSPDVFLSCSSDWTIQLWKQDHLKPVLGFTSTQTAVCDVQWSPKWATVFGAVNEEQLEIWDLDPVSVQPAAAGVKMTSLLFATQTECVLVGDSDGQVTVYQLKNL
uniref:Dynein axonemal intermediate chain 4 n=1 Tax=Seriola lalandi dorsalis TaxID=1841481 RepID=A0A3B4X4W7_SERLL